MKTLDSELNKSLGVNDEIKKRGVKKISSKKKKQENIYDLTIIKEDDNEHIDSIQDDDRKLKINVLQPGGDQANETDGFKTSAAYSESA